MITPSGYFEWLCSCVCEKGQRMSYGKMLDHLFRTQFTYIIDMDANRISDGIDLRYRYGRERGEHDSVIASVLDIYPCNVLEVLVALCIRIESVMDDPQVGNRTGYWFWILLDNLNLTSMSDVYYNKEYVDKVLYIFMERKYRMDGSGGGIVWLKHPRRDVRFVELWEQVGWYLSENYI